MTTKSIDILEAKHLLAELVSQPDFDQPLPDEFRVGTLSNSSLTHIRSSGKEFVND
jgi:hypothetical protein